MEFFLKPDNRNVTDQELIDDIIKIAQKLDKETITRDEYDENGGRFHSGTIRKRLGGWLNALEKAGLSRTINYNVEEEDLFKTEDKEEQRKLQEG